MQYYGDVSAIRFLLANGEPLRSLGEDIASMLRPFTATGGSVSSSSKGVPT
jgi:hypothetical protein